MAARGRNGARAFSPASSDLLAPERPARQRHFRPVFVNEPIIDAEFEPVDPAAPAPSREEAPMAGRYDGRSGRLDLFGRRIVLAAAPPPRMRAFPILLAGLCGLSFWVFGGHAVFARLAGHPVSDGPLAITDISTRLGVIDGMRVAIVNGRVRNLTESRQPVPPIGVIANGQQQPVTVRPAADMLEGGASTGFRIRLPLAAGAEPQVAAAFVAASVDEAAR